MVTSPALAAHAGRVRRLWQSVAGAALALLVLVLVLLLLLTLTLPAPPSAQLPSSLAPAVLLEGTRGDSAPTRDASTPGLSAADSDEAAADDIPELCNRQSTSCHILKDFRPSAAGDNGTVSDSNGHRAIPRVLYYNTHGGTTENMRAIVHALDLPLDLFNPKQVTHYGMAARHAAKLIAAGHAAYICSLYDVVIIGDTVPHGRALLQSVIHPSRAKQCHAKIVVEMTNRFNWDIQDRDEYYSLIKTLIMDKRYQERVYWVANNNVEQAYVERYTGAQMPDVRLLRPVGISKDYEYPSDL
ncbi:hypothetical protein HDU82_004235, partial [Entophlyctis luteolus]